MNKLTIGIAIFILAAVGALALRITSGQPDSVVPAPPPELQEIIVALPQPNDAVSSPLQVAGQARGWWFFEGDFPIRLIDANGQELAVVPAQAQGEWMTEDLVDFSATLNFDPPQTTTGTIIFERDNPSGLPENDQSISLPISF